MKFKVLGCFGGNVPGLGMTSFLVNGKVGLDAGWISDALTLREQENVKDVFISHSHLDHTASLPFLIDNNFSAPGFSLRIHAIREVIAAMKTHLFNNQTWPDFTSLPNKLKPVLKLVVIPEETPVEVGGLSVRAVRVSHTVPTTGFLVKEGQRTLAFTSDTGPTRRFWEVANATRTLRAAITEVSFPDEQQRIADVSGHLTPQTLALELLKLKRDVPVYLYGRKPRFAETIAKQLRKLSDRRLKLLVQGRTYPV
jgi:ribonuclease BN (tRNA processing enzyme)